MFLDKADMREKVLSVLVVGPAENILKITAHARKEINNEVTMFEPKFDELKANLERGYFVDLKKVEHLIDNDIFVKVSTFTGDLEVEFFTDSGYRNMVYAHSFHHMGDSQFRFSKKHRAEDNITDSLFMRIKSIGVHSTFVISVSAKVENLIRLYGELAELSELDSNELDNYYVNIVKDTYSQNKVTAKFVLQTYTGTPEVRFSVCKG